MREPTEVDWARLAAYIDGEGSIFIAKRTPRCLVLGVVVYNTDARLASWLKQTFGGSVTQSLYGKREKFMFRWDARSRDAVSILEKALPYFIIKREQAEKALEFGELIRPRGFYRIGNPASKEMLAAKAGIKQQLTDMKVKPCQIM